MKKVIGLLCVAAIIVLGGLAYLETEASVYDKDYFGRRDKEIYVEDPFEKDVEVQELLEHINSVGQKNNYKESNGSIRADRTGAVAEIDIYKAQLPEYQEQVEKIERVLGLEGLVDYIYGEEQQMYEEIAIRQLEIGEDVKRVKQFGNAFVTVRTFKSIEEVSEKVLEEGKEYISKTVFIKVLRDELKNKEQELLVQSLEGNGYYLVDLIQGGAEEMLVFKNTAELSDKGRVAVILDDKGEITTEIPSNIRYEILAKGNKVQQVRGIMCGRDKLIIGEADIEMFIDSARELGLDESQLTQLRETIEETLAKPMKDRKEKVGEWDYQARYTQESLGEQGREIYLDISIRPHFVDNLR